MALKNPPNYVKALAVVIGIGALSNLAALIYALASDFSGFLGDWFSSSVILVFFALYSVMIWLGWGIFRGDVRRLSLAKGMILAQVVAFHKWGLVFAFAGPALGLEFRNAGGPYLFAALFKFAFRLGQDPSAFSISINAVAIVLWMMIRTYELDLLESLRT